MSCDRKKFTKIIGSSFQYVFTKIYFLKTILQCDNCFFVFIYEYKITQNTYFCSYVKSLYYNYCNDVKDKKQKERE